MRYRRCQRRLATPGSSARPNTPIAAVRIVATAAAMRRFAVMRHLAACLLLVALSSCGEGDASNPARPPETRQEVAREAAFVALRNRRRPEGHIEQRGVQVFTQAMEDVLAVCGRARMPGTTQAPYWPYVAVVELSGEAAAVVSFHLGASGAEASRVFLDMVERCFDGGGPASARPMVRSVPPLPEAAAAPETSSPPRPAPAPLAASGSVTASSRMGANIRSSPRGGEVVRVMAPGSSLQVLGEAPGGWFQVGEAGVALGWVHASVLEGR